MSSTTVLEAGGKRGFVHNLLGVIFSPAKEFTAILPKARWWRPLILLVLLQVGFTAVWLQKIDKVEFIKAEVERSGRMERIPVERRAEIFATQARVLPAFAWGGALLGPPLLVLAVGGMLLFVLRFFAASEISFPRVLTVVAWAFAVVALVTTPLVLATLYLKGDWSVNPRMALQANLAMFLDQESAPKALYALLASFDLFVFWALFLQYTGFRVATPLKPGTVTAAVLGLWAVFVLCKTLLAALF